MPKPSNRDKLLLEGMKLVHRRGFAGSSVRDIVQAADVPQGCFTNHFESKEAFGLEILEMYDAYTKTWLVESLRNEALAPLERIRAYLDQNRRALVRLGLKPGCLYGNFSAELSDQSEPIRLRLAEMLASIEADVAAALRAAVAAGDLERGAESLAAFVVTSLQGAVLITKTERTTRPLDDLERVLFDVVFKKSPKPKRESRR